MVRPFKGVVNVDVTESVPDWGPYTQPIAPEGTPSVLYIVLDDVGYSAMESFGGSIETPNINRIADRGLLYTNFHTTALCSPTRSCLMTGRNHTTNGMATITEPCTDTVVLPLVALAAARAARDNFKPGVITYSRKVFIPLTNLWVTANFKETQLSRMRPGQPVTIKVDALGGRKFHGKVTQIGGATGSKLSLFPPENATGNYVKVVQRIPVRIDFTDVQQEDGDYALRPGMSVTPEVEVK